MTYGNQIQNCSHTSHISNADKLRQCCLHVYLFVYICMYTHCQVCTQSRSLRVTLFVSVNEHRGWEPRSAREFIIQATFGGMVRLMKPVWLPRQSDETRQQLISSNACNYLPVPVCIHCGHVGCLLALRGLDAGFGDTAGYGRG